MKKGEFLGFDVLDVSSICIETICRPGTIAKPNILLSPNWGLSTESSDKYSSQVPKMTLASLSVHRKMPMRTRPSVNLIFMFLFSKLRNNFRPGKSNGKTFLSYILRALLLLLSFTFKNDRKIGWLYTVVEILILKGFASNKTTIAVFYNWYLYYDWWRYTCSFITNNYEWQRW